MDPNEAEKIMTEILQQINDLSGAGLQYIKKGPPEGGGEAPPEGASPEGGAPPGPPPA